MAHGHHGHKYPGVVQTRPVRRCRLSPRLFPGPNALYKRSVSSASCVQRRRGSETRASCENNGPPRNRRPSAAVRCVQPCGRECFSCGDGFTYYRVWRLDPYDAVSHVLFAVALCGSRSKGVGTRRHKTRWGRLRGSRCMWSVGRSVLVEFRTVSVWTNEA